MAAAVLVLAVVLTMVVVSGAVWWIATVRRPDRLLAALHVKRVMVTLKTGEAFDGLLTATDTRSLELRQAAAVGDGGSRLPVDGMLLIPRGDVAYLQDPSD